MTGEAEGRGYGGKIRDALEAAGIRAEMDSRNEKLGYRFREAQLQKIPYAAVVGDAEQASESVQVRAYGAQLGQSFGLDAFRSLLLEKIAVASGAFRG